MDEDYWIIMLSSRPDPRLTFLCHQELKRLFELKIASVRASGFDQPGCYEHLTDSG